MTEEQQQQQLAEVVRKDELLELLQPLFDQHIPQKSTFVYWLASMLVTCSFVFFGAVAFLPIHCESNIVFYLLGATTAVLSTVVSYFFGSSSGSTDKNDIFKSLANTAMTQSKRRLELEGRREERENG